MFQNAKLTKLETCDLAYLLKETMHQSNCPPCVLDLLTNSTREKRIPHEHIFIRHARIISQDLVPLHTLHNAIGVAKEEVLVKIHSLKQPLVPN